jgi:hypothetical protein
MAGIETNMRSISAGCVQAAGLNTWIHTALMHGVRMQQ